MNQFSARKLFIGLISLVILVAVWTSLYRVDATEVAIFQAPVAGTLTVESAPGTYLRFWSSVTPYHKQDTYGFEYFPPDKNKVADLRNKAVFVQFNDGGKAEIGGNIQWDMPLDQTCAIALHKLYGSQLGVDQTLIRNAINRAMTLTAPLMSATESYAARRAEFIQAFTDQLINGIYLTETSDVERPDPITGQMKKIKLMTVILDSKGMPSRSEDSQLKKYCINIQPPTLTHFIYEEKVETQIQQVRDNTIKIQTQQAEAQAAVQQALTAEAKGRATAADAKWQQETIKAREVTKAEQEQAVAETNARREKNVQELNAQRDKNVATTQAQQALDVARLDAQTADNEKRANILRGEGEAGRRQLVLAADGALDKKGELWLEGQKVWAQALGNYQGSLVPQYVMGGGSGGGGNAVNEFMQMMSMQAAKALSFDPSITVAPATQAPRPLSPSGVISGR